MSKTIKDVIAGRSVSVTELKNNTTYVVCPAYADVIFDDVTVHQIAEALDEIDVDGTDVLVLGQKVEIKEIDNEERERLIKEYGDNE